MSRKRRGGAPLPARAVAMACSGPLEIDSAPSRRGEGEMRLEETALRLDGQPVSVAEVLAGSVLGGFGRPLLRRVGDGLAALPAAAAKGIETSAADIQEALDRWRTERDLIAADEFRAWMKAEDLDLKRVAAWLDGELLRERLEAKGRAALEAHQPDRARVFGELHDHAVLNGALPDLAAQLALRLVAPSPGEDSADAVEAARFGLLAEAGFADLGEAVESLEPLGVSEGSILALLDSELAFRLHRSALGTEEQLQRELKEHRDELVRFEVADASFENDDIAREVLCCVREDGESLRRSTSRAGEAFASASFLGPALTERLFGNRLFAAKAKEIFGPEEADGRHHVAQLVRKVEPDFRSEQVRDLLRERLIRLALRRDLIDRVVFAIGEAA